MATVAPSRFGSWSAADVSGLAAPSNVEDLVQRLYDEVVERIYTDASSGYQIMVLLAHGAVETDQLQLHRPEVCYTAFGYKVSGATRQNLSITPQVALPAQRFLASTSDRQESVAYWTRIGEDLPTDGTEQRLALLDAATHGELVDGLLARFSTYDPDFVGAQTRLDGFVRDFLRATPAALRPSLIGTTRSLALQRSSF
jgi:EpsI family protein